MFQKMKKFLKSHKNNFIIGKFFNLRNYLRNYLRNKKLKKAMLRKKTTHIVIICQCESIWNKTRNLFIRLLNKKIKCSLYIVKDNIINNGEESKTIFEREFSDYCYKYEDIKLKKLKPSIVIYTRPYECYLPEDLHAFNVLRFAKTAYVPYYFSMSKPWGLFDEILTNINYFFATTYEDKVYFDQKCYVKNIEKGIQKSFDIGYPLIDDIKNLDNKGYVLKNINRINVIWTPRWTTDRKYGGSNFLKYYKDIFRFFINNIEYSFVFRPHPLLLNNMLKTGELSKSDVDCIINNIESSNNCKHDCRKDYLDIFLNSDILISDYSSLVVEYFLTGKPIIYCWTDSDYALNNLMNELLECNYIAYTFEDIIKYLNLIKENDIKYVLRKKKVEEFFNKYNNSTDNIINELLR